MDVEITPEAMIDYEWWKKIDKKKYERINKLINSIKNDPFKGIGKPEPLKYEYHGCWSRRVDKSNRLVYTVDSNTITILSCRYHY